MSKLSQCTCFTHVKILRRCELNQSFCLLFRLSVWPCRSFWSTSLIRSYSTILTPCPTSPVTLFPALVCSNPFWVSGAAREVFLIKLIKLWVAVCGLLGVFRSTQCSLFLLFLWNLWKKIDNKFKMCVIAGSGARLRTAKRVKGFLELSDVSIGEFERASSTQVTSIYSGDTDTHGLLVESSVKLNLG